MTWYAAHAVMFVRFADGVQDHYPVMENVLLIEAADDDAAHALAVERARAGEHDSSGTYTCDGRRAAFVFAGIRKIVRVAHCSAAEVPGSGDELTWSMYALPDRQALDRLVADGEVDLRLVE
jgi:hypothetical protein